MFRLFSHVLRRFVDNGDTCAFSDGVASAQDPRGHASSPFSTGAVAKGISAYTNANLSWSSGIRVRLSRTNAIASSGFARPTARIART